MDNSTAFAMILDYFSDIQALFNTQKLPSGFRVLTSQVSSGRVGKNIDFSSIGRVRVAQKML